MWASGPWGASESGDIGRFASPAKLCGYTGLCPRVKQSGAIDAVPLWQVPLFV